MSANECPGTEPKPTDVDVVVIVIIVVIVDSWADASSSHDDA